MQVSKIGLNPTFQDSKSKNNCVQFRGFSTNISEETLPELLRIQGKKFKLNKNKLSNIENQILDLKNRLEQMYAEDPVTNVEFTLKDRQLGIVVYPKKMLEAPYDGFFHKRFTFEHMLVRSTNVNIKGNVMQRWFESANLHSQKLAQEDEKYSSKQARTIRKRDIRSGKF